MSALQMQHKRWVKLDSLLYSWADVAFSHHTVHHINPQPLPDSSPLCSLWHELYSFDGDILDVLAYYGAFCQGNGYLSQQFMFALYFKCRGSDVHYKILLLLSNAQNL